MKPLDTTTNNQQRWSNALLMHKGIHMLVGEMNYCVLLASNDEETYKRPENIRMPKQ
jgi:hypothetical protein